MSVQSTKKMTYIGSVDNCRSISLLSSVGKTIEN